MAEEIPTGRINASPTKSFFIDTLVKDIDLIDAILDLIDNSIDSHIKNKIEEKKNINLTITHDTFIIEDDCGGMEKRYAEETVFRFGKTTHERIRSIGVYGIGLKRAIFKIGKNILLESDDTKESFSIRIDNTWLEKPDKWDLDFEEEKESSTDSPLFRITITDLYPEIAAELNTTMFLTNLIDKIKMTYSVLIESRINISVNNDYIEPKTFKMLNGSGFRPLYKRCFIEDTEVDYEIYAGFTSDVTNSYGWYVFFNDRLILNNDTTSRTGWGGKDGINYHYSEDNQFLGMIFFYSDNPFLLPWQTTKDDVQLESRIYRQAQVEMKAITNKFVGTIRATGRMKDETGETIGRAFFKGVDSKSIFKINEEQVESIPEIEINETITESTVDEEGTEVTVVGEEDVTDTVRKITYTYIQYSKEKNLVKKVKKSIGKPYMSNKALGEATFDYYIEMEDLEDE